MIEGSDNGAVLTLHQVPWNEDVEPSIDDEGELEGWKYNGVVSWDFDLGNEKQVGYFQTAHNFIYQCSNRLKAFVGTLAELQAAGADLEKDKMYWGRCAAVRPVPLRLAYFHMGGCRGEQIRCWQL